MSTRFEIATLTLAVIVCLTGSTYALGLVFKSFPIHLYVVNDSPNVQEMRYLHDDGDNEGNKSYSSWQAVPPSGALTDFVYGGLYCVDARTASGTRSFLFDTWAPEPLTYDTPTLFQKWILRSPGTERWEYRLSQFQKPCTYTEERRGQGRF